MRWWLALLALVALVSCRGPEHQTVTTVSNWPATREAIIEEYLKAHPAFAVAQGRHEYDGLLPDWSANGIAAEIARLHVAKDQLMALGELVGDERFERDHLVARFDRDLFWLETAEAPFTNPEWYFDRRLDSLDPTPYLARTYASASVRIQAFTKYARAVQRAAVEIRANLRTPLSRPLAERGIAAFNRLAALYESDVPQVFTKTEVESDALRQHVAEANGGAAKAMRDLAAWLKSQLPAATASYVLGTDKFSKLLDATERVNTPLAELEAAGRADMTRNQQALREACARYAPGAAITACIAKAFGQKAPLRVLIGGRAQLEGLKKVLADTRAVSIPTDDALLVQRSPSYNREDDAYIEIPGPYENRYRVKPIYYIDAPDPEWTPEAQLAYLPGRADLLFTSVHETWPGHFLQFLHSHRAPPVGRLFVGDAFAEGWAHYAEEMMWDVGFGNGDPETHVGQLTHALLRNARLLSAIGLHTGGMTIADSERLFLEQAYTDVGTAQQQAARGTYDPAYLSDTMGKLMIRKLRADWTATRGGRTAWRRFHDEFLSHGGPPIPMLRQLMLGNAEGKLF